MSIEPRHNIQAGAAFKAAIEPDPATQAALQELRKAAENPEVQAVTVALRRAMQELMHALQKDSLEDRKVIQDLVAVLAANKKALEERLRAEGLPVPRTIEDWEDLALFIEEGPSHIGSLTIGEIARRARIWAQRENWRLGKIATLMAQRVAGASEAKEASQHRFIFCRDGNGWFIRGFGEERHFEDLRGFQYLAKLLAAPKGVVKMRALVAGFGVDDRLAPEPGSDDVLDPEAIKACEKELEDIDDAITEARRNNDQGALERLEEKKQQIIVQLKAAKGRGGKPRKLGDSRDNLRSQIRNAVNTACDTLEKHGLENLAEHFRLYISADGDTYTYRPKKRLDWQFSK